MSLSNFDNIDFSYFDNLPVENGIWDDIDFSQSLEESSPSSDPDFSSLFGEETDQTIGSNVDMGMGMRAPSMELPIVPTEYEQSIPQHSVPASAPKKPQQHQKTKPQPLLWINNLPTISQPAPMVVETEMGMGMSAIPPQQQQHQAVELGQQQSTSPRGGSIVQFGHQLSTPSPISTPATVASSASSASKRKQRSEARKSEDGQQQQPKAKQPRKAAQPRAMRPQPLVIDPDTDDSDDSEESEERPGPGRPPRVRDAEYFIEKKVKNKAASAKSRAKRKQREAERARAFEALRVAHEASKRECQGLKEQVQVMRGQIEEMRRGGMGMSMPRMDNGMGMGNGMRMGMGGMPVHGMPMGGMPMPMMHTGMPMNGAPMPMPMPMSLPQGMMHNGMGMKMGVPVAFNGMPVPVNGMPEPMNGMPMNSIPMGGQTMPMHAINNRMGMGGMEGMNHLAFRPKDGP